MFNYKYVLILLSCLVMILCSCKKETHEPLPELDSLGNNMNPASGIEYVKLDSTKVYNNITTKILKSYISINDAALSDMGFTWSRINVYKNGISGTYLSPVLVNKVFLDNVVSGQVLKFEFTIVDSNGRESKKSKPYIVIVP